MYAALGSYSAQLLEARMLDFFWERRQDFDGGITCKAPCHLGLSLTVPLDGLWPLLHIPADGYVTPHHLTFILCLQTARFPVCGRPSPAFHVMEPPRPPIRDKPVQEEDCCVESNTCQLHPLSNAIVVATGCKRIQVGW